uniref:Uncharacterized protein n=1 Tax=Rhizophora mucronata TaxID=61149 RepID=A0A2P2MN40_RHIMU
MNLYPTPYTAILVTSRD